MNVLHIRASINMWMKRKHKNYRCGGEEWQRQYAIMKIVWNSARIVSSLQFFFSSHSQEYFRGNCLCVCDIWKILLLGLPKKNIFILFLSNITRWFSHFFSFDGWIGSGNKIYWKFSQEKCRVWWRMVMIIIWGEEFEYVVIWNIMFFLKWVSVW